MILDADKLEIGIDMLTDYLSRDIMVLYSQRKTGVNVSCDVRRTWHSSLLRITLLRSCLQTHR